MVVVVVAQNCWWNTDIMNREDIMARVEIPVVEIPLVKIQLVEIPVVEIAQKYHRGPKRS